MRWQIPLLIVFLGGLFMAVQYFVPLEASELVYENALDWIIIVGVFAMALGLWSMFRVSVAKIQSKAPAWGYNIITLVGLFGMILLGLFSGIEEGKPFMNLFWYIYTPIQATMFSLLAFYIASAAYRAFRARTLVATILLLTAILIMLRLIPLGSISGLNQTVASWILSVPNMAAKRAIAMGIGLGGIATALKVVLGIERSYMGKD
ncbi:MAG: hypothetical protein ABII96_04480 [Candidatus Zixiibacteriota bacterium]